MTVLDTGGVKGVMDDVVADTGQVLDPAAANQHHGVLLRL